MSKKVYLFSLVLLALAFTACSETEEVSRYDNWQSRNESYIDSVANVYATSPNHGGLNRFELLSAPGEYIYYKVKKEGEDQDTESPKYMNYAKVHYKGTNILNEVFDGTFTGSDPITGDVSEGGTSQGDSKPAILQVCSVQSGSGGLITGWVELLQRMKVGDRWEVYIPWKYAYGRNGDSNGTILGYSTLIFDVMLLDFGNKKEDL